MMTTTEKSPRSKKASGGLPTHLGGGRPLTSRPEGPGTALANWLIDFLPHTNLTNEQIADRLGYVRPNIVSMWKMGRTKVTLDAVWALSEILQVDITYLLALYFEQYVASHNGVDHMGDLVGIMGRVATEDEWEIIKIAREARNYNSVPLTGVQRSAIKAALKPSKPLPEGPLREAELKFAGSGDRRRFSKRGHAVNMTVTEIEEANARKAEGSSGAVRKAGKLVASQNK